MMQFSANLGFLWTELAFDKAIRAAHGAGFDAVEAHWPYEADRAAARKALDETGLPLLGVNTTRGDTGAGEMGLSALPGRNLDARRAIDEGLELARDLGARNLHVMAGKAEGAAAYRTFVENLAYACDAAGDEIGILVEPLNHYDAPGYFLQSTEQARGIIAEVDAPNLKLMFDCYHVQLSEGDVTHRLEACMPVIGHIQFAAVPDRGPPDHGELNYSHIFKVIAGLGWTVPLGAEYRPEGTTEDSLAWMAKLG